MNETCYVAASFFIAYVGFTGSKSFDEWYTNPLCKWQTFTSVLIFKCQIKKNLNFTSQLMLTCKKMKNE